MQRIKSSNTVTSLPTSSDGNNTAGYFSNGDTATGEKATYLNAEFMNRIQEELVALATASGLTLSDSDNTQCATAVAALIASAVSSKANIASPTLTGTPAAPTASEGTSTTQIATTAFVMTAIATLKALFTDCSYTMAATGHVNFPSSFLGGFQIRWGWVSVSVSSKAYATASFSFEKDFSTSCFGCVPVSVKSVSSYTSSGDNWTAIAYGDGSNGQPDTSGGTIRVDNEDGTSKTVTLKIFYVALGH